MIKLGNINQTKKLQNTNITELKFDKPPAMQNHRMVCQASKSWFALFVLSTFRIVSLIISFSLSYLGGLYSQ